jgi:hypothetical protein
LSSAYPPADDDVGIFLTKRHHTAHETQKKYMSFLEALFKQTVTNLESYTSNTQEGIASKWYEWMKEGATVETVGINRQQLYRSVLTEAVSGSD